MQLQSAPAELALALIHSWRRYIEKITRKSVCRSMTKLPEYVAWYRLMRIWILEEK